MTRIIELDRLRAINAELVAALQAVVDADTNVQHAAFTHNIFGIAESDEERRRSLTKARAAIAKAKGE